MPILALNSKAAKLKRLKALKASPARRNLLMRVGEDLREIDLHRDSAKVHSKRAEDPKIRSNLRHVIRSRVGANIEEIARLERQINANRELLKKQRK